jgi:SAM-dependent methyltransferase
MSSSVVMRPTLSRRVARACGRVSPIAVRTWEGSLLPVEQAEPVEAAMPGSRSRRSMTPALIDTTASDVPLFTFERPFSGTHSRFRCDLALLSEHLTGSVTVTTRPEVRNGPAPFTDHSALLIDLPVTPEAAEPADVLFSLSDLPGDAPTLSPGRSYQPHKTAMNRTGPSPASQAVTAYLTRPLAVTSVLDHGCGRGADIAHYRSHHLDADGFDPHDGFGWPRPHRRDYDLVTSMFVLNVLPDPWQRIQALQDAASFTRPGGHVVVVTRSPDEIAKAATDGRWSPHQDGFWSSRSKGTFQRGIDSAEITALARWASLIPAPDAPALPLPGVCYTVLLKPEP